MNSYSTAKAQAPASSSLVPQPCVILQRVCACGKHTGGGGQCEKCKQKRVGTLQRAAISPSSLNEAPPIVHDVLRSTGQPLDAGTCAFMEPRFGHDFSSVLLHTDAKAAESARAVNALAYTVGSDVVFGAGQYAPHTSAGKRLLAHELAHVVQQNQCIDLQRHSLQFGPSDDQFESQANDISNRVSNNQLAPSIINLSQIRVQRDLARPPRGAPAPLQALTPAEIQAAITFNQFASAILIQFG